MFKPEIFVLTLITLFTFQTVGAQDDNNLYDINDYKYIKIPIRFDFQKEDNQYLLTSLTKHLFEEENYNTFVNSMEIPDDYAMNNCLGLTANLVSDPPQMFTFSTDVTLELVNCKNQVVFSHKGTSRKKSYEAAYKEAARKAFEPLRGFDYAYNGNKPNINQSVASTQNGRKTQKEEETEISEVPEMQKAVDRKFNREGNTYILERIEAGFILRQLDTDKRFGFINKTSSGDYLFNSDGINGTAKINGDGNLIVEYFDRNGGRMKKLLFKRQDDQ